LASTGSANDSPPELVEGGGVGFDKLSQRFRYLSLSKVALSKIASTSSATVQEI
jgi:hypothetical protein